METAAGCDTEGVMVRICSACKEEDRITLPASGHKYIKVDGELSSCTKTGFTDSAVCSLCGYVLIDKHEIPTIPHTPEIDEAVPPALNVAGLTEGSHCSVCNKILVEQQVIPKLTEADFAYTVIFECNAESRVSVYNTKDYSDETINNVAYSRNSDTGLLDRSGDGQVNFAISIPYGYALQSISVVPEDGFKNLKDASETKRDNTYRITKIKSDLTVNIVFEPILSDFPAMIINTAGADITSKEDYLGCTVRVINSENMLDEAFNFENKRARIKGRGNTSWYAPKKSYKLKFDSATDLFGNGKEKTWNLIANYYDPSQLRNALVYSIGTLFDSQQYTTTFQYVDLFLNGEYRGVYMVCEQVEVGENRVNIGNSSEQINPKDSSYLLEMDLRLKWYPENKVEGSDFFYVGNDTYALKYPESGSTEYSSAHFDYIKSYLTNCYISLDSGVWTNVIEYIDPVSFAENYIMCELFKSGDVGYSSIYMYKPGYGRLCAGPVWDYDISAGNFNAEKDNVEYSTETLFAKENNLWFSKLLTYDEFSQLVADILEQKADEIISAINCFVDNALTFTDSYGRNYNVWPMLLEKRDFYYSDEMLSLSEWSEQVDYLKNWVSDSLKYMTQVYCGNI